MTKYKIGTPEHAALVVQHIQSMLKKCKIELETIRSGRNEMPITFGNSEQSVAIWNDIQEERHEYLEGLQSKLQFIIDYPEREQTV